MAIGGLERADRRFGAALATPATVAVLLLVGGPALQTLLFSFQDKKSFSASGPFVGLDNYARVLNSANFQASVNVTFVYAIGFLVLSGVSATGRTGHAVEM